MLPFDPSADAANTGGPAPRSVSGYFFGPIDGDVAGPPPCRAALPTADVRFASCSTQLSDKVAPVMVLRSHLWHERFGLIDGEDVPVMERNEAANVTRPTTLAAFLKHHLVDGEPAPAPQMMFPIRFQAVFVPNAFCDSDLAMMLSEVSGYDARAHHKPMLLNAFPRDDFITLAAQQPVPGDFSSVGTPAAASPCFRWSTESSQPHHGTPFVLSTPDRKEYPSLADLALRGTAAVIQVPVKAIHPATTDCEKQKEGKRQLNEEEYIKEAVTSAPPPMLCFSDTCSSSTSSWEEFTGAIEDDEDGWLDPKGAAVTSSSACSPSTNEEGEKATVPHVHCEVNVPSTAAAACERPLQRFAFDHEHQGCITISLFFPDTVAPESVAPLLDKLYVGKLVPFPPVPPVPASTPAPPSPPPQVRARFETPAAIYNPSVVIGEPMQETYMTCRHGHRLKSAFHETWAKARGPICDHCCRNLASAQAWFQCRECDLDLCTACHAKAVQHAASMRSDMGSAFRASEGVVLPGQCMRGHPLINLLDWWGVSRPFPGGRFSCDVCRKFITRSSNGYCCRECNYDVCEDCHRKSVVTLRLVTMASVAQPSERREVVAAPAPGGADPTARPSAVVVNCRKTCPRSHGLTENSCNSLPDAAGRHFCDVCSFNMDDEDTIYSCRTCNYDLCENCYLKCPSCDTHPLTPRPARGPEVCYSCHRITSGPRGRVYDCSCRHRYRHPPHPPRVLCERCFMNALQ